MYKKHKHRLSTDFNRHTDNIFYKCNKLTTIALYDRFYFTAYVCALYYILSDSDFNSYLCVGKRNDKQPRTTNGVETFHKYFNEKTFLYNLCAPTR